MVNIYRRFGGMRFLHLQLEETAGSSKMSVNTYETISHHIPENGNLNSNRWENPNPIPYPLL
jgi:hypothetical protein